MSDRNRNRGTKRKAGEEDHGAGRSTLMDLPEELMADVLRRLPPRYLAACRSVCRCWRDAVDGRGMLLAVAHLVPRHVRGILINFARREGYSFFSRAVVAPSIDGALGFLPRRRVTISAVLDHHNGLVLCEKRGRIYACNPATRRWGKLPRPPIRCCPLVRRPDLYLVFDPTVSLHYEVLLFLEAPRRPMPPPDLQSSPSVRENYEHFLNTVGSMEWPPRLYPVLVFSSSNGQWENRQFTREEGGVDAATATTVSDVWSDPCATSCPFRRYGVYWRGEFYLHFHGDFVVRLSFLEGKYLVVRTPKLDNFINRPRLHTATTYKRKEDQEAEEYIPYEFYLSKSKQGVYFTVLYKHQLLVWILQQQTSSSSSSSSCRMLEWELKHQADLMPSLLQIRGNKIEKSWILSPHDQNESQNQHDQWDSDDDNVVVDHVEEDGVVIGNDERRRSYDGYCVDLLGYHPYKEIAFLGHGYNGFAYYLGSSKLQYLGSLSPKYLPSLVPRLESFVYTPCSDDLLPCTRNHAS